MLAWHAQDKIATFWEIGKREAEDRRAELRNKDREMEELEERHQVEIKARAPLWSLWGCAVHISRDADWKAGWKVSRQCVCSPCGMSGMHVMVMARCQGQRQACSCVGLKPGQRMAPGCD